MGGALAGQLLSNNNDGTAYLLDTIAHTATVIASGGSRGDYVGFDTSNGTLFLSQTESVLKLKLAGGGIGGDGNPPVPEPASWMMMIAGFAYRPSDARSRSQSVLRHRLKPIITRGGFASRRRLTLSASALAR